MRGRLLKLRNGSLPGFCVYISQSSRRPAPRFAVSPSCYNWGQNCQHPQLEATRAFTVSSTDLGRSKRQKRENKVRKTALPVIPTTKNEKLNKYVSRINREVFQVDHIPARYRKLVLNPALHGVLQTGDDTEDYVTLTIDGQTVPLIPVLNPEDRKAVGRVVKRVIKLCNHPSDFDIFPQLIDGMTYSKLEIKPEHWVMFLRATSLAGRSGVAITVAHNGVKERRNQFPGKDRAVVRELYRGLLVRFLMPDGPVPEGGKHPEQFDECKRALTRAALINRIVTTYPILPGGKPMAKKYRFNCDSSLKYDPTAAGVVLYMNAEVSRRYRGGKDIKGDVLRSLAFMRRVWEDAKTDIAHYDGWVKDPSNYKGSEEEDEEYFGTMRREHHIARHALFDYEIVLKGLQLAKDIVPNSVAVDTDGAPLEINVNELLRWQSVITRELEAIVGGWRKVAMKQGGPLAGFDVYENAAKKLYDLREATKPEDRVGNWWKDLRDVPVNMSGRLVETEEADEKIKKAVMKN